MAWGMAIMTKSKHSAEPFLLPGKLMMRVEPRVPHTGRDSIAIGVTSIDPAGRRGKRRKE